MKLFAFACLALTGGEIALAQSGIHACAAEPGAQQIYAEAKRSSDRVKALREGLAKYPDDLFLNRWLLLSPGIQPGALAGEYRSKLDAHPAEPLFLFLYGQALIGKDTPAAIDYLHQALAKDPDLVFAHWALLDIYDSPKYRNPAGVAESIRAFTARCPQDVDVFQYIRRVEDIPTLRELTALFRHAVENRDTVGVAAVYPNLWAAEFRVANPKDFEQLRVQIRKDMDRIRKLDPTNINQNRSLAQGYELLGDSAAAESLRARKAPPRTYNSDLEAFQKSHDFAAALSNGELLTATEQWVKDWPQETNAWYWRLIAIDSKKDAAAADIVKAGEDLLAVEARQTPAWNPNPSALHVAAVWENHDIRLRDCISLARQAIAEMDREPKSIDDRHSIDAMVASYRQENGLAAAHRFEAYGVIAGAARKLEDFPAADAVVAEMKSWFDSHPGNYVDPWNIYHKQAAQLAEAEQRKPDALAHYQMGWHDEKTQAHALALWNQLGGTSEGFDLFWKRPDPPKIPSIATVALEWTKMEQSLAALHSPDLTGKIWTIADLKGKTTLINVWATWCGPCRDELPSVQKLYDQVKDRTDIQVITISTDENPGMLAPFLEKEHYTFPVLPAKTLVDDLVPELSIPRTWIVDSSGTLRAERVGYYAGDWPDHMLEKLQSVR